MPTKWETDCDAKYITKIRSGKTRAAAAAAATSTQEDVAYQGIFSTRLDRRDRTSDTITILELEYVLLGRRGRRKNTTVKGEVGAGNSSHAAGTTIFVNI